MTGQWEIQATRRGTGETYPGSPSAGAGSSSYPLAAEQALGDVVGLALGAHRRGVGGEVAGGGDQRSAVAAASRAAARTGGRRPRPLDGVEVAVLAQQQAAEGGDEPCRLAAAAR